MKTKIDQERIKFYVKELDKCADDRDFEGAHSDADRIIYDLLRELGLNDIASAYDNVSKQYA